MGTWEIAANANASIRRLLAAFAAINIAEWGFVTALSIEAFRVDGTLAVGLIGLRLIAGAASSAVLSPLFDRARHTLPVIAAGRALVLSAAAGLVAVHAPLGATLALVVLDSVIAAPYRPAQSRLIPALARSPEEVTTAAAGISIVKTLAQATGALLAGFAVDLSTPAAAMAGAAFVMVTAIFAGRTLTGSGERDEEGARTAMRSGLRAFPVVLRDPVAWPLVTASILRTLVRGLWSALLVVVALRLLALGSSGVGLLQACAGLGALIALPITATLIGREQIGAPCALSFVLAGLTVSVLGAVPAEAMAMLLVTAWGISMAVADATSLSLLHRLKDSAALGRTISVMEALKLSAEGAGALLAPVLVSLFGLRPALLVAGSPLPLLVVVSWGRINRSDALAQERGKLVRLLHGLRAFRGLDMASLEQVAALVVPTRFDAGTDVVVEGDHGDRFYAIESGQAEIVLSGYPVARLGAGQGFGERALLRDSPRAATVRAVTPLSLYALDRASFLAAVTGFATATRAPEAIAPLPYDFAATPVPELLAGVALFAQVPADGLTRLAAAGTLQQWADGAIVVREGDSGSEVYVVVSGRARVTRGEQTVGELLPGDSFGEIALLHTSIRAASIIAVGELTTLSLPREAVTRAVQVSELAGTGKSAKP